MNKNVIKPEESQFTTTYFCSNIYDLATITQLADFTNISQYENVEEILIL